MMRPMFEGRMEWADEEDIRLLLYLAPDDGVDPDRLRKFYEKYDFHFDENDHAIRLPLSERGLDH